MREIDPLVPWGAALPATGDGPLNGLRLAVKDVLDVAGQPTGAGHPRWLDSHPVPAADAAAVAGLRRAGARLVGKTHTDELAYSLAGTNAHYGVPRNPAAPGRIPGGSSSGTASAVAAGLADLGLGTDTAGSIRVPAAFTGLYGLRPTHSRVSRDGCVPLAPSFDVPGLLARDPAVLRAAAPVLLDPAGEPAPPARLLLPRDLWSLVPLEIGRALRPALAALPALEPDTAPLFPGSAPDWAAAFSTVQAAEVWAAHGDWIRRESPEFGPGVTARLRRAASVTPAEAAGARATVLAVRDLLRARLDGAVLALPTAPMTPPPVGARTDRALTLRLTTLAPIGGLPALSVPGATVGGLPLGLSLLGAAGSDLTLLALAR